MEVELLEEQVVVLCAVCTAVVWIVCVNQCLCINSWGCKTKVECHALGDCCEIGNVCSLNGSEALGLSSLNLTLHALVDLS